MMQKIYVNTSLTDFRDEYTWSKTSNINLIISLFDYLPVGSTISLYRDKNTFKYKDKSPKKTLTKCKDGWVENELRQQSIPQP